MSVSGDAHDLVAWAFGAQSGQEPQRATAPQLRQAELGRMTSYATVAGWRRLSTCQVSSMSRAWFDLGSSALALPGTLAASSIT